MEKFACIKNKPAAQATGQTFPDGTPSEGKFQSSAKSP